MGVGLLVGKKTLLPKFLFRRLLRQLPFLPQNKGGRHGSPPPPPPPPPPGLRAYPPPPPPTEGKSSGCLRRPAGERGHRCSRKERHQCGPLGLTAGSERQSRQAGPGTQPDTATALYPPDFVLRMRFKPPETACATAFESPFQTPSCPMTPAYDSMTPALNAPDSQLWTRG